MFSEIAAAIAVNTYNCRQETRCVIAAQQSGYAETTLAKCWTQLDYLNGETEDGFKKLRQVRNTALHKKASVLKGKVETGWGSEIVGIIADKPNKIRGDRTDVLFYEEAGSWPNFKKAYIQGEPLVVIQGVKHGIRLAWGTGGDSGPNLEGLADAFYNPLSYNALPYRHNYVENEETVLTGYFIPAYTIVTTEGYIDHRGWTDPEKGKQYYQQMRDQLMSDPKALLIKTAEYCFTPEEALALEGTDEFGSVTLAEQLTNITLHKMESELGPIQTGYLEYQFDSSGMKKKENITGFKWIPNSNAKIHILEHPLKNPDNDLPYKNLYVAGIDGIDMGSDETSVNYKDPSQFCLVIMRRTFGIRPPQIVCYYKDRPKDITEAYITSLKLLQYYDAQAVLESSKISILTWFRTKGMANRYLMRRPRSCLSDITSGRSNLFGAQTTEPVIRHQISLIREYCLNYTYEIWFPEVLTELIKYSYENKRKFDIIAAFGMCLLGDEEMTGRVIREHDVTGQSFEDIGYYTDQYGVKRFGVIPKNNLPSIIPGSFTNTNDNDKYRIRTSDPRRLGT